MKRPFFTAVLALALTGCADHHPPSAGASSGTLAGSTPAAPIVAGSDSDRQAIEQAQQRFDTLAAQHRQRQDGRAPTPVTATPVTATDVLVTATPGITGIWRLVQPTTLMASTSDPDTYGNVQTFICRFQQDGSAVTGSCLPSHRVDGDVQGDQVTLHWSKGLVSVTMTGTLATPTDFKATLTVRMLGMVGIARDIPAFGSKVTAPPHRAAADDGDAARLRAALPLSKSAQATLGPLQDQYFIERIALPHDDQQPAPTLAVYDLEFQDGWRLCGIKVEDRAAPGECL